MVLAGIFKNIGSCIELLLIILKTFLYLCICTYFIINSCYLQIEELKAALSNREYGIIMECAQTNISETPDIVPPLKDESLSPSIAVMEHDGTQGLDPAKSEMQARESWIATKISVRIDMVELCLHYGVTRDTPLATLQVIHVLFFWL